MKTNCFLLLIVLGLPGTAAAQVSQVHIRRTYYDEANRRLHEEYQYISTPTNRFCKQGYYKEYNEDGTLWRKQLFHNNRNEGRQLEYETTDGQTWIKYDIMVRGNLRNGPYIRYSSPNEKIAAGNYVNGEQAGRWTFYEGDTYEVCTYENNEKEGPATRYWRSGKVADHYVYRAGEKRNIENGDYRAVNEDGTPWKSGHFTGGEMDGEFRAWYSNGQLRYIEHYVMGSREGRILAFNASGDTLADDGYEHDVLVRHRKSAQEAAQEQEEASEQAQRQRRQQQRDSAEAYHKWAASKRDSAASLLQKVAEQRMLIHDVLIAPAYLLGAKERELMKSWRSRPEFKLYGTLYDKLYNENYRTLSPSEELAIAKQLSALMKLTQQLAEGQQPELLKAVRKENNTQKLLVLLGL